MLDTSILHCHSKAAEVAAKNDATIDDTQIVESVRLPDPAIAETDETFDGGARQPDGEIVSEHERNSVNQFDRLRSIDYCSSNNSTVCAWQNSRCRCYLVRWEPITFIRDNEIHFENEANSMDKDFIVIAGLVHGITPCNACPGGPYNNSQMNFYDYLADWLNKPGRF